MSDFERSGEICELRSYERVQMSGTYRNTQIIEDENGGRTNREPRIPEFQPTASKTV